MSEAGTVFSLHHLICPFCLLSHLSENRYKVFLVIKKDDIFSSITFVTCYEEVFLTLAAKLLKKCRRGSGEVIRVSHFNVCVCVWFIEHEMKSRLFVSHITTRVFPAVLSTMKHTHQVVIKKKVPSFFG